MLAANQPAARGCACARARRRRRCRSTFDAATRLLRRATRSSTGHAKSAMRSAGTVLPGDHPQHSALAGGAEPQSAEFLVDCADDGATTARGA